jgi:hypothetical protein
MYSGPYQVILAGHAIQGRRGAANVRRRVALQIGDAGGDLTHLALQPVDGGGEGVDGGHRHGCGRRDSGHKRGGRRW